MPQCEEVYKDRSEEIVDVCGDLKLYLGIYGMRYLVCVMM